MNSNIKVDHINWDDVSPRQPAWVLFIFRLTTQVSALMALVLLYEAYQWIHVGYGLNPFLAIPVAVFLLVAPHWFDN